MGLFNKYNQIEEELLGAYTQMSFAMGIPLSEAKDLTKGLLDQAIEESKKAGSYYLPSNFGDIILDNIKTDNPVIKELSQKIRAKIPKKKTEGVREENMRWWWNMNDIERRMMIKSDESAQMFLFVQEIKGSNKLSKEIAAREASQKVRKYHPMYGDPDDTTHTKGDDRPLPYELKDRINIYIEKRAKSDPEKYKAEIEQSTTFNALIRKEIRAGRV